MTIYDTLYRIGWHYPGIRSQDISTLESRPIFVPIFGMLLVLETLEKFPPRTHYMLLSSPLPNVPKYSVFGYFMFEILSSPTASSEKLLYRG